MAGGGGALLLAAGWMVEQSWLAGVSLPARRQLAVLFVDIVDSTGLIETQDPQRAFEAIERLMSIVVAVGVAHCGDVRDFEGDGALLYFAGTGEALPAAFAIRDRIARAQAQRESIPEVRMGLAFAVVGRSRRARGGAAAENRARGADRDHARGAGPGGAQ